MKNLFRNRKAITSLQIGIVIAIILVVGVAAAFMLGSSPTEVNNGDITVYIDTVKQIGNYTQPQTLSWGTISALNTYTKNFTVANTGASPYNLLLITAEPVGTSQSWSFNNTVIAPATVSQGTLTLTLSMAPQVGAYTWMLYASNGTMPEVTPTPNPASPTPIPTVTPNSLSFTINADTNVQSVDLVKNNASPYTISTFPATFAYTQGDTLKFTPTYAEGYILNGWVFSDGSLPVTTPILTLSSYASNFTVTVQTKLAPTT